MGSSMLQKMSAESRQPPVTEEKGEKKGHAKKVVSNRRHKVVQTGELVAAETESVEHKSNAKPVFDGGQRGEGDAPAAGELVTNTAKSQEVETRGKETKSTEIEGRGKETFDGDDHEAENEDSENEESSTEEALQEAVQKAVAHSEAATPPVQPFATKTGWKPILDEKDEKSSAPADVIFAKGTGKAKKAHSQRASKETELGSASATKTGRRMIKLDKDRLAAIENKVKVRTSRKAHKSYRAHQSQHGRTSHKYPKSPQHDQRGIKEEMGPLGVQEMKQPRGQEDAKKLTVGVGAPDAKTSAKSMPHGAVTSPVNTGSYDIKFAKSAKHAQDGGEERDSPCKQADGCPGGGKR